MTDWNAAQVRTWLDSRIAAARADQASAIRAGRSGEDDCDRASAQEMVSTLVRPDRITETQAVFAAALRDLQAQDDYHWRGVCDDARFDRHVRAYLRTLAKMTAAATGFDNLRRYQRS